MPKSTAWTRPSHPIPVSLLVPEVALVSWHCVSHSHQHVNNLAIPYCTCVLMSIPCQLRTRMRVIVIWGLPPLPQVSETGKNPNCCLRTCRGCCGCTLAWHHRRLGYTPRKQVREDKWKGKERKKAGVRGQTQGLGWPVYPLWPLPKC